MSDKIDVLDHGFVRLIDVLGSDLTPVNAARVSFDKRSSFNEEGELRERDLRLLNYLLEHGHTSPLRHAVMTFEVYAPLMVMRQWGKYRVGSTWTFEDSDDPLETQNESSRRYVTEEPVFYTPKWRWAAEDKKQGSGPEATWEETLMYATEYDYGKHLETSIRCYETALLEGFCPEQARLFLPAYALYVRAYWTVSLQGVLHFIQQRTKPDAQHEIAEYAWAVWDLAEEAFPETFKAAHLPYPR